MIEVGDYVTHNTFPPIEGYVSVVEKAVVGNSKIAVLNKVNGNLFWDSEDTWNILKKYNDDGNDNSIDVECVVLD